MSNTSIHADDIQVAASPDRVGISLLTTIALALSGCAELASIFFIQPMLPKLASEYNVPMSHVSIIMSSETALLACGLLFTGTLADHFGRKQLIVASLLLGGLVMLLCPLASSWGMLVVMCALIGLLLSGIAASATAYISEEVPPGVAGIVTGYFVFGNSMGGMSGRVISSQLMSVVPISTIFYLFGGILIGVALFVLAFLPRSQHFAATPKLNFVSMVREGAQHFRNPKISLAFIISFVIFGTFTSLYNFLAFNLHRPPFSMSYAHAGLISICFALSFFTAPGAGRLAVRFGTMNVLAALLGAMILGIVVTALAPNSAMFIVGAVIFTVAFFGCHSLGLRWVARNANMARAQATAFYLFAYYLGGSVVGYINGLVFTRFDWAGLTVLVVALLLGALAITRVLDRLVARTSAVPVI